MLDDFARGKLAMALACGLTQREAAAWVGTSRPNVQYRLRKSEFVEDLRRCTDYARLHPLLRLFQAAGESWKIAASLLVELELQHGPLTTDDIIDGLCVMLDQVNASYRAPEAQGE